MSGGWTSGNHAELLENGDAFFPRVFEAIAGARHEVLVETFILEDDEIGRRLLRTLTDAAARDVRVELTVDAWGSMRLPDAFIQQLVDGGVCFHRFDPAPAWRLRVAWFRRLHRKLVVVDGERAFVGGINFVADQVTTHGPDAKQDYAVEMRGPVVADIHRTATAALARAHRRAPLPAGRPAARPSRADGRAGTMDALFVTRDNRRHRSAIERRYREAINAARHRLVIANAYFFPGYRLLRDLRRAARRGVDVRLVLQGEPDLFIAKFAASLLYDHLLQAGVRIFEYCKRPYHGKIAVADDTWATVGSSNLDPLSLALNLEANVMVRDRAFTTQVADRLDRLMAHECTEVQRGEPARHTFWRPLVGAVAFHVLRHFPRWAGWLPAHEPVVTAAESPVRPPKPQRESA